VFRILDLYQSRLKNAPGVIASAAKQSGFLDCHGLNDRPRNDDPPFSKAHIFNAIGISASDFSAQFADLPSFQYLEYLCVNLFVCCYRVKFSALIIGCVDGEYFSAFPVGYDAAGGFDKQ
jgi:hypothetical protein